MLNMSVAEMELAKVHQILDLANVPKCEDSVNRLQARIGVLLQREAHWQRCDVLNHDLLASYEKQLGITPADDTGTIGSRIEEMQTLLRELQRVIQAGIFGIPAVEVVKWNTKIEMFLLATPQSDPAQERRE